MRFPKNEDDKVRLGIVIVDDEKRGKGYGKEMISMAVRYAFDPLKADKISLGVFANNPAAIRCYRSAGFSPVALENPERYRCFGEVWDCIEMQINRLTDEEN